MGDDFALDSTDRDVATVMAWMLPGGPRIPVPVGDADRFVGAVMHQRVSGPVLEAVESGALAGWPDDIRPRLVDAHLAALRSSLAAEAASVGVSDLFNSVGIRHAVLKGCATAHLDYPDPAMRVTGDVGVLIDRDDCAFAIATLEGSGRQRMAPAFRTGWERRYGKDIALIGEDRIEIDLHLALVAGYFGIVMPTTPLLERLVTYEVADRQMSALDAPGRLVHAAIHTASTAPSGAHMQPWTFVAVADPAVKRRIREAAEEEERVNYLENRMNDEWQRALAPLGTDHHKEFLEIAPWIVVLFERRFGEHADGSKRAHYYVKESVGMAAGLFVTAIHQMGLATLPHTPTPMAFLRRVLDRPGSERPFVMFPVGHPLPGVRVPDLRRKPLDEVAVFIE